jgi:superfamily II DNA or RNA helicase
MNLRPYQIDCLAAVKRCRADNAGAGKFLVVIPTGGGKTICFAKMAEAEEGRVLILAHREELIQQAVEKLHRATGIFATVEMADQRASLNSKVVVASVQTMMRRRERFPVEHFSLIIVDEAHHVLADSYLNTLARFDSHACVIGFTATPDRGDRKNLGKYFQQVAFEISLLELVNGGYLVPIKVRTLPLKIDLSGLSKKRGDYDAAEVGAAIDPILPKLADSIAAEAWDRKPAIFLPLVKTSQDMARLLRERGVRVEHVDGMSEDRAGILRRLARDETRGVCNAMLLTEGWDEPSIDCIVNLRPTKVRALYSQIVGRGTRLHPGKSDVVLLDFLWQSEQHSLIKPAHLVAKDEEEAVEISAALAQAAGGGDGEPELLKVSADVEEQRLRKIKESIEKNKERKPGTYDALDYTLAVEDHGLAGWEPSTAWDTLPATEGQLGLLDSYKIDISKITMRGHASALIELVNARRDMGLASPAQVMKLKQFRHPSPHTVACGQAAEWLAKEIRQKIERRMGRY